jgi:hypothetical protein
MTFGSAVVIAVERIDEAIPDMIRLIKINVLFRSVNGTFMITFPPWDFTDLYIVTHHAKPYIKKLPHESFMWQPPMFFFCFLTEN